MKVCAGFLEHTDYDVGRLIEERLPVTLFSGEAESLDLVQQATEIGFLLRKIEVARTLRMEIHDDCYCAEYHEAEVKIPV